MIYVFACDACGVEEEVERPMADASLPHTGACGHEGRRVYASSFHCDEIRGTALWDPKARGVKKQHGKYFDVGLGRYITSKSQRKQIVANSGVQEYGAREI